MGAMSAGKLDAILGDCPSALAGVSAGIEFQGSVLKSFIYCWIIGTARDDADETPGTIA